MSAKQEKKSARKPREALTFTGTKDKAALVLLFEYLEAQKSSRPKARQ